MSERKKYRLRNLLIDRADLVDKGANQEAFIELFKRADVDKHAGPNHPVGSSQDVHGNRAGAKGPRPKAQSVESGGKKVSSAGIKGKGKGKGKGKAPKSPSGKSKSSGLSRTNLQRASAFIGSGMPKSAWNRMVGEISEGTGFSQRDIERLAQGQLPDKMQDKLAAFHGTQAYKGVVERMSAQTGFTRKELETLATGGVVHLDKHAGPGNHPSGSGQEAHGGGGSRGDNKFRNPLGDLDPEKRKEIEGQIDRLPRNPGDPPGLSSAGRGKKPPVNPITGKPFLDERVAGSQLSQLQAARDAQAAKGKPESIKDVIGNQVLGMPGSTIKSAVWAANETEDWQSGSPVYIVEIEHADGRVTKGPMSWRSLEQSIQKRTPGIARALRALARAKKKNKRRMAEGKKPIVEGKEVSPSSLSKKEDEQYPDESDEDFAARQKRRKEKGKGGKPMPEDDRMEKALGAVTKGLIEADVFVEDATAADLRDILPGDTVDELDDLLKSAGSADPKKESDMAIDPSAVDFEELAEYIEGLEGQVADLTKRLEETQVVIDEDVSDIEKALAETDLPDGVVEILKRDRKRLEDAESRLAKAEENERTAAWVAKAEALPGIVDNPDEFGPVLREIADADEDLAKSVEDVLAKANERISKGDLFSEVGSGGSGTSSDSALGKATEIAKSLMESSPELSVEEARGRVWEMNPELYEEYRSEAADRT